MIGPSVDLIVPIMEVIENKGPLRTLAISDGIFSSFSDASIHNWEYFFKAFDSFGEVIETDKFESYYLAGKSCDSGDIIKEVKLPANLRPGDYLWVPNAGAYLSSQATNFNGFQPHNYKSYNTI